MQICLAAGLTLSLLPRVITDLAQAMFRKVRSSSGQRISLRNTAGLTVLVSILASSVLSTSRICGILMNYSAPMYTWAQLHKAHRSRYAMDQATWAYEGEHSQTPGTQLACVGAEWHRFPSSFFLPEGVELAFVEAGFDGVLLLCDSL